MIKNNYDYVIVGKNVFSLLLGIIKIREGKKVLIIDDERIKLSGSWINYLSDLEKRFLELIGTYYNVRSLLNINDFIRPSETVFWLNNKHIILGSSYKNNLVELCRKLPEIFDISLYDKVNELSKEVDIDELFLSQVNDFIDQVFKYHNFQDFDEKFVMNPINDVFVKYSETYKNALEEWSNPDKQLLARQFLFVQQVVGQTFFTDTYSQFELQSLILNAIGPRFKLNERSLTDSLSKEFVSLGGHIKQVEVEQWQLYNDKLEHIMLSSYEGLIHFKNCLVFGNLDDRFPFQIDTKNYRSFSSIQIQIDYPVSIFGKYAGRYLTYCSLGDVGTDFPLWQARFDTEKRIIIKYLYSKRSASKPEFHFNQALKNVYETLKKLFPSLEYEKFNFSNVISDGDEVWIEKFDSTDRFLTNIVHNKPNRKRFKLKIQETNKTLNGIDYWGPQRARPSGMFSYLMELKNTQF